MGQSKLTEFKKAGKPPRFGNPSVWNPPGLASLKLSLSSEFKLTRTTLNQHGPSSAPSSFHRVATVGFDYILGMQRFERFGFQLGRFLQGRLPMRFYIVYQQGTVPVPVLWFLNNGPGGSGSAFDSWQKRFRFGSWAFLFSLRVFFVQAWNGSDAACEYSDRTLLYTLTMTVVLGTKTLVAYVSVIGDTISAIPFRRQLLCYTSPKKEKSSIGQFRGLWRDRLL